MKRTKTTMMLVAKWLIVLAISFVVLPGNVFASKTITPQNPCSASCIAKCPCCVSKAPAPRSSAPFAPTPQSRVNVEKNFNFLPVIVSLLSPLRDEGGVQPSFEFSVSSCEGAPLYQRHCTYLI
jgi:hypothetical protein